MVNKNRRPRRKPKRKVKTVVAVQPVGRSRRRKPRRRIVRSFPRMSQMGEEYMRCALGLGAESAFGIPDEVTDLTFSVAMKLTQLVSFGTSGNMYLGFFPGLYSMLHLGTENHNGGAYTAAVIYDTNASSWTTNTIILGTGTTVAGTYYPYSDVGAINLPWLGLPFQEFQVGNPRGAQFENTGQNANFYATAWRPISMRARLVYGGTDLSNSGVVASCSGSIASVPQAEGGVTLALPFYGDGFQQYTVDPPQSLANFSSIASAQDGMCTRLPDGLAIELKPSKPTVEFMPIEQGYIAVEDTTLGLGTLQMAQMGCTGGSTPHSSFFPHLGQYGGMDACAVAISGGSSGQTVAVTVESCVEMKVSRSLGIARHMARASPEYDPVALQMVAEVRKRMPIATPAITTPTRMALENIRVGGGSFAGTIERFLGAIGGGVQKLAGQFGSIFPGPFGMLGKAAGLATGYGLSNLGGLVGGIERLALGS